MYIVRNVFSCKAGKARELVAKLKAAAPHLQALGIRNVRVLTDAAAGFWTVVAESEVESLDAYFQALAERPASGELQEAMAGYMDLVAGGHREIFRIE